MYLPDGEQARSAATESEYDLVILDLNLPKLDGVSVLRHLRLKKPSLPVLGPYPTHARRGQGPVSSTRGPTITWPSPFLSANSRPAFGPWCGAAIFPRNLS